MSYKRVTIIENVLDSQRGFTKQKQNRSEKSVNRVLLYTSGMTNTPNASCLYERMSV